MRARTKRSQLTRARRRVLAGLASTLLASSIALAGSSAAVAATAPGLCDFAVFIGVRGTGAPGGAGLMHNNRAWATGGHGDEIVVLKSGLISNTPLPIYAEALNYPAADGANYVSSVMTGRATLIAEINWIAQTCGPSASIILAGHSQGGAVVLSSMLTLEGPGYPNLTTAGRNAVQAVAAFGEPNNVPRRAIAAPGSSTTGSGVLGPRVPSQSDQLDALRYWGWPMGGSGQGWVQKIRSWCFPGDTICTSETGANGMAIHNSYGMKAMTDARKWIEYMYDAF